jgi:Uma2 family endonuclease
MSEDRPTRAVLRDLYGYEGKAELIDGRIVQFPLMGHFPGQIALTIACSLQEYARRTTVGEAYGPGLIYAVPALPNGRESFCPDGSYHRGPFPEDQMSWIEGAPTFAVEIRVWEDYQDPDVEARFAAKRSDYFRAGSQAVWDVDPLGEKVTLYKASDPTTPVVFRRGDTADAEPAVPGWRLTVDDVFA